MTAPNEDEPCRALPASVLLMRAVAFAVTFAAAFDLDSLTSRASAQEPAVVDAAAWRSRQIDLVAEKVPQVESLEERLELAARQSWLRRWNPGQMPGAPVDAPDESGLVMEPLLTTRDRPPVVAADQWTQITHLQTRLLAVDTDDDRKNNLRKTIPLAQQLETALAEQVPSRTKALATRIDWALAYTRYRLGRALAYRELPVVLKAWPISDPDRYETQLESVFQRLNEQTNGDRPEFILLQDRMFRRSGKKGQALELLEAHRKSIEPKWYLKKRRDLLKELQWDPPYREAARLYRLAGYDDDQ